MKQRLPCCGLGGAFASGAQRTGYSHGSGTPS